MDATQLAEVLRLHGMHYRGEVGGKLAHLQGAHLQGANLQGANLQGANLQGAHLQGADLQCANLQGAHLQCANLQGAHLQCANLQCANLQDADLQCANLQNARLQGAHLQGAYLPSPTMVLLASWGAVSSNLCRRLMAFDAANHPDPKLFSAWKNTDVCPYADVKVQRAANFHESKSLWSDDLLDLRERPYDLMVAVLKECCKFDG